MPFVGEIKDYDIKGKKDETLNYRSLQIQLSQ